MFKDKYQQVRVLSLSLLKTSTKDKCGKCLIWLDEKKTYDLHTPNDQNHGSMNNAIRKFFYSDYRKFVLSLKLFEKLWPVLNGGSIYKTHSLKKNNFN